MKDFRGFPPELFSFFEELAAPRRLTGSAPSGVARHRSQHGSTPMSEHPRHPSDNGR